MKLHTQVHEPLKDQTSLSTSQAFAADGLPALLETPAGDIVTWDQVML